MAAGDVIRRRPRRAASSARKLALCGIWLAGLACAEKQDCAPGTDTAVVGRILDFRDALVPATSVTVEVNGRTAVCGDQDQMAHGQYVCPGDASGTYTVRVESEGRVYEQSTEVTAEGCHISEAAQLDFDVSPNLDGICPDSFPMIADFDTSSAAVVKGSVRLESPSPPELLWLDEFETRPSPGYLLYGPSGLDAPLTLRLTGQLLEERCPQRSGHATVTVTPHLARCLYVPQSLAVYDKDWECD